jgi:hypothetical protein
MTARRSGSHVRNVSATTTRRDRLAASGGLPGEAIARRPPLASCIAGSRSRSPARAAAARAPWRFVRRALPVYVGERLLSDRQDTRRVAAGCARCPDDFRTRMEQFGQGPRGGTGTPTVALGPDQLTGRDIALFQEPELEPAPGLEIDHDCVMILWQTLLVFEGSHGGAALPSQQFDMHALVSLRRVNTTFNSAFQACRGWNLCAKALQSAWIAKDRRWHQGRDVRESMECGEFMVTCSPTCVNYKGSRYICRRCATEFHASVRSQMGQLRQQQRAILRALAGANELAVSMGGDVVATPGCTETAGMPERMHNFQAHYLRQYDQ